VEGDFPRCADTGEEIMPVFEIESGGKTYEVDAPDMQAAAKAAASLSSPAADKPKLGIGETVEDAGRSFAAGVGRGAIGVAGLPADIESGMRWLQRKLPWGPTKEEQDRNIPRTLDGMTSEALREKAAPYLPGIKHEPKTTVGEYARTTGEFIPPALVMGTGSLASRLGLQAALPAVSSEAAGQATNGTALEPYARVAGAIAPALATRAVTPFRSTNPTRDADVALLRQEGVNPTAGQATGSRALQYTESATGGEATRRALTRQGEQFTEAVLRRAGEPANRARPEIIDRAFERIGNQFDDLAARNVAVPDRQLGTDIGRVAREYDRLVPPSGRAPIVAETGNDILQTIVTNNGSIPGEAYQALRSRLDRAARASARDPQLQYALRGYRNALDDVMERSITPADQAAWRQARNQYRNLLVVEKAATGAGSDAAQGIISPSQLRNATVSGHGRRNYARGDGDFAELARAGESVLKPLPDSGTAGRAATIGKQMLIGGAIASGDPMTILKAVGGAVAPTVGGRILMTGPVQTYLSNQAMGVLGRDVSRGAQVGAGMQIPGLLGRRREDHP
jgi:hypothetical protein